MQYQMRKDINDAIEENPENRKKLHKARDGPGQSKNERLLEEMEG
jgi:hypothetical protein